jgi:hypothetical protein
MTIGATDLARKLNISRERVYQLTREGKIARESDGKYDLSTVRSALKRNLDIRQPAPSRGENHNQKIRSDPFTPLIDGQSPTLANVQLQHEIAKAAKAQIELKRMKGLYVEAVEVEREWGIIVAGVQTRLMLLPDKIAPKVPGKDVLECKNIIEHEIREALTALSEYQFNAA